ncbi:MAG TPA: GNAT family N-acetyltransferase [Armatimonadota bacterium]
MRAPGLLPYYDNSLEIPGSEWYQIGYPSFPDAFRPVLSYWKHLRITEDTMVTARSIKPEELDRAGEIGAEAFEMDLEPWVTAFHRHAKRFSCEHIPVVEHEGRLVAAMMITPEDLQMGDVTVPGGAVGGVGTAVAARRIGCAAAMMTETVRRMVGWGITGSAMWPFSYAYYRKFGWETGGEVRISTWPRDIQWLIEPDGDVSVLTPADAPDVSSVWDALTPGFRCSTARAWDVWESLVGPERFGSGQANKTGFVCRRGGKPVGYAMYEIPEPKDGEKPAFLEINEIRALDGAAAVAIIRAVMERTDFGKYRAAFSVNDRVRSLAVNARAIETELHASFGFRIIHPDAIFPLMKCACRTEPVTIRIHDELVGTRTWKTALDGSPAEIVTSEPDVDCDIRAFTPIASGFVTPSAAASLGWLQGDASAVARLQEATSRWSAPFRSGLEEG